MMMGQVEDDSPGEGWFQQRVSVYVCVDGWKAIRNDDVESRGNQWY